MRGKSEAKARSRVNELAEKKRLIERERVEAIQQLTEIRAEKIRSDQEPDQDLPLLEDGERARIMRKEQLLRDRIADEPAHQAAIRQVNELNAA